ncbi:hypothetical protein ROZALSC1DRAFT_28351 [Rozella allomycis CSF55]|uniref:Uncharacterized protein n=1 Tax=Rozella allomycis (strain CSF55) TaxID=988480 RepID=A0A4P9YKX7_ROZAC|nr:hypothetical protein ROZALSC1DRAFT_28351 [Rozella allomycis CSF55]
MSESIEYLLKLDLNGLKDIRTDLKGFKNISVFNDLLIGLGALLKLKEDIDNAKNSVCNLVINVNDTYAPTLLFDSSNQRNPSLISMISENNDKIRNLFDGSQAIWATFPVTSSLALIALFFQDGTKYNMSIDGFENNSHLMIYAVKILFNLASVVIFSGGLENLKEMEINFFIVNQPVGLK